MLDAYAGYYGTIHVIRCDACKKPCDTGGRKQKSAAQHALEQGFKKLPRRRYKNLFFWLCPTCYQEWPPREILTAFVFRKLRERAQPQQ